MMLTWMDPVLAWLWDWAAWGTWLGLACAGLALGLLSVVRWRRRRARLREASRQRSVGRRRRQSRGRKSAPASIPTRHPLVLAHGFCGFDSVGISRLRQAYFRGVRGPLETRGYEVHVPRVAPFGGVQLRARQLARQIRATPAPRVNVIAHSMGGLDARYAIAHLGIANRVASLTTIGTPHRGTPLVDRLGFVEWSPRLRRVPVPFGNPLDGLSSLRTREMHRFNQQVLDAAEVRYGCVLAAVAGGRPMANWALAAGHAYLARTVGPSDGLVPVTSQLWGEVILEIEADHWGQIGWSCGFDAQAFYLRLAQELAMRGL